MNANQVAPVIGYYQNWGTKNVGIYEMAGPSSYATGGVTVNASQLGFGGFDLFDTGQGLSYSGTYFCRVQYLPVDAAPSAQNPGLKQVSVLWYVLSTGNEVGALTDLSGEIVRVFAVGV